jgi:hypothetical protein
MEILRFGYRGCLGGSAAWVPRLVNNNNIHIQESVDHGHCAIINLSHDHCIRKSTLESFRIIYILENGLYEVLRMLRQVRESKTNTTT